MFVDVVAHNGGSADKTVIAAGKHEEHFIHVVFYICADFSAVVRGVVSISEGSCGTHARHLEVYAKIYGWSVFIACRTVVLSGIADVVGAACKQSERGGSKEEFSEKIHMSVVILV